jgi:hypothetical protein
MYRSRKPECEEYTVKQIYQYIPASLELLELEVPSLYDQLQLIMLIYFQCIKEKYLIPFREDKISEIDEYIRHVLPTLDDRRKNSCILKFWQIAQSS